MKMSSIVLGLVMALTGSGQALAHPDHAHEEPAPKPALSEESAKARAKKEVHRLIAIKKLDDSWKDVSVKSVEKKQTKSEWEWLVTFENAKATKDKVLYVFLKPQGDFVAANFTGK